MPKNNEVQRLREEVQRRIKSANAKIARTQKSTGANLSGTEFDPRRRTGIEKTYNRAQLTKYLGELNSFMRRSNQFVGGRKGQPIPRGQFNLIKAQLEQVSQLKQQREAQMSQVKTPVGFTVAQKESTAPRMGGHSRYSVYPEYDIEPGDINGVKGLNEFKGKLAKILKQSHVEEVINQGRSNLIQALEYLDEDDMVSEIESLSDYQFDVLWFGTNMAEAAFMRYEFAKEREGGTRKEKWQDKVVDTVFKDVSNLIEWAKTEVPRERPNA